MPYKTKSSILRLGVEQSLTISLKTKSLPLCWLQESFFSPFRKNNCSQSVLGLQRTYLTLATRRPPAGHAHTSRLPRESHEWISRSCLIHNFYTSFFVRSARQPTVVQSNWFTKLNPSLPADFHFNLYKISFNYTKRSFFLDIAKLSHQ